MPGTFTHLGQRVCRPVAVAAFAAAMLVPALAAPRGPDHIADVAENVIDQCRLHT